MIRVFVFRILFVTLTSVHSWGNLECGTSFASRSKVLEREFAALYQEKVKALSAKDFILVKALENQIATKVSELKQAGIDPSKIEVKRVSLANEKFDSGDSAALERALSAQILLGDIYSNLISSDGSGILMRTRNSKVEFYSHYDYKKRSVTNIPQGALSWKRFEYLDLIERNDQIEIIDNRTGKITSFAAGWKLESSELANGNLRVIVSESLISAKTFFYNIKSQKLIEVSGKIYDANEDVSFLVELKGGMGNQVKFRGESVLGFPKINNLHMNDYALVQGGRVLVVLNSGKIEVYNLVKGKLSFTIPRQNRFKVIQDKWLQVDLENNAISPTRVAMYDLNTGKLQIEISNPLVLAAQNTVDTRVFGQDTVASINGDKLEVIDLKNNEVITELPLFGKPRFLSPEMVVFEKEQKLSVYSIALKKMLVEGLPDYSFKMPYYRNDYRNDRYFIFIEWNGMNGKFSIGDSRTGAVIQVPGDFGVEMIDNGARFLFTSQTRQEAYVLEEKDLASIQSIIKP